MPSSSESRSPRLVRLELALRGQELQALRSFKTTVSVYQCTKCNISKEPISIDNAVTYLVRGPFAAQPCNYLF